jgi:hypothetical protein
MIDNNLWGLLCALFLKMIGIKIDEGARAGLGFLACSSWVPLEATLLAWIGTTPGKWLLNIRLLSVDGTPLKFGRTFQRARRVWIYGLGLGLLIFPLFTLIYSYYELHKHGTSTWDNRGGTKIQHGHLNGLRRSILVLLCASLLLITLVVILSTVSGS